MHIVLLGKPHEAVHCEHTILVLSSCMQSSTELSLRSQGGSVCLLHVPCAAHCASLAQAPGASASASGKLLARAVRQFAMHVPFMVGGRECFTALRPYFAQSLVL